MIQSILKKIKKVAKIFGIKVKDPWKEYYNDIPEELVYDGGSMVDAIVYTGTMYPNNIAIEYYNAKLTYLYFIEEIKKCAKALKQQGVKENDYVTICMPNTPESVIMFYAINMVGAIANMIHPLSSEKEIELYLNKTNSKIILTIDVSYIKVNNIAKNTKLEKIIVASATKSMGTIVDIVYWFLKGRKIKLDKYITLKWHDFIKSGKNYDKVFYVKRKASDPATILYSGGTTGNPKGVVLSNLSFNAAALQTRYISDSVQPETSVLTILPNFHAFGIGICTHTPLYNGMKVILIPQFEMKKFAKIIKRTRPNVIAGVPSLYDALTKMKFKKNDLECIRFAVCGGDIMTQEQKKRANAFLKDHGSNTDIRVGYGLTEACGACALSPSGLERYKDIIGIPFPDNCFKIVKPDTLEECEMYEDGEICICSPNVMLGYLNEEGETKQVLKKHDDGKIWLHTGDVGYIDKSGYIFFKSRIKRLIITSGYNVYPNYVEEVLKGYKDIKNAVVIGIPHPYKGEAVKAFIVLEGELKPTAAIKKDILKYMKKNLSNYAIPSEIEYVRSIPMTLVGKVSYKDLK